MYGNLIGGKTDKLGPNWHLSLFDRSCLTTVQYGPISKRFGVSVYQNNFRAACDSVKLFGAKYPFPYFNTTYPFKDDNLYETANATYYESGECQIYIGTY